MTTQEPTLHCRELGRRLRQILTEAGVEGNTLAAQIGRTPATISLWLSGQRHLREVDVAAVLGICQVPYTEWEPLLRLAGPQVNPVMVSVVGPVRFGAYRHHVEGAARVAEFGATEVPWPVRTPQYARALARPAIVPYEASVGLGDQIRTVRPVLLPETAVVTVLVHEWVVRTPVGGPEVMAGQLEYLERLSQADRFLVRVVPVAAGGVGACGSFGLVGWPSDRYRPAVLRFEPEALVGCDDPGLVGGYGARLAGLERVAWDPGRSREFLGRMAREMAAVATRADTRIDANAAAGLMVGAAGAVGGGA